jgi:hypothetical protein
MISANTIHTVLVSSATLAAIFLALLTMFIVLRESGRLAGLGEKGLRPYLIGHIVLLVLIILSTATSIMAFLTLMGNDSLYSATMYMFLVSLIGILISGTLAVVLTK